LGVSVNPDPKPKTKRDPKYLKYIRSFPCHVCHYYKSTAHHEPINHRGMGLKGSDRETIPLCRRCHTNRHTVGRRTFWYAWDLEQIIKGYNYRYGK